MTRMYTYLWEVYLSLSCDRKDARLFSFSVSAADNDGWGAQTSSSRPVPQPEEGEGCVVVLNLDTASSRHLPIHDPIDASG